MYDGPVIPEAIIWAAAEPAVTTVHTNMWASDAYLVPVAPLDESTWEGQEYIFIDAEAMRIVGWVVPGGVLTVERGALGTAAADHAPGAPVHLVASVRFGPGRAGLRSMIPTLPAPRGSLVHREGQAAPKYVRAGVTPMAWTLEGLLAFPYAHARTNPKSWREMLEIWQQTGQRLRLHADTADPSHTYVIGERDLRATTVWSHDPQAYRVQITLTEVR